MSRASKQIGTNVTKKLLVEIQVLIAFARYDSPAIAKGGESMTEGAQSDLIKEMYFRSGGGPEIISYVDQFIHGLHRFTGLFTLSEPDESGQIVLTMSPKLHRHAGLNIFVGSTSITKKPLLKKSFASNNNIHPQTLTWNCTAHAADVVIPQDESVVCGCRCGVAPNWSKPGR